MKRLFPLFLLCSLFNCIFFREFAWMSEVDTKQGKIGLNASFYVLMPYFSLSFSPNKHRKCDDFIIDSLSGFVIFHAKDSSSLKLPFSLNQNNNLFKPLYPNDNFSSNNIAACEAKLTPFDLSKKVNQGAIDSVTYDLNAILIYKNDNRILLKSSGKMKKYRKY